MDFADAWLNLYQEASKFTNDTKNLILLRIALSKKNYTPCKHS